MVDFLSFFLDVLGLEEGLGGVTGNGIGIGNGKGQNKIRIGYNILILRVKPLSLLPLVSLFSY